MAAHFGRKIVFCSAINQSETISTVMSMTKPNPRRITPGRVFMKNNVSDENLAMLDHYKTLFKISAVENGTKNKMNISVMQFIIALYINLNVTNSWFPILPNDLGHNIFAVTL